MLGTVQRSSARQKLYWLTLLTAAGLVTSVPILFKAIFKSGSTVAVVNGLPIEQREYRFAVAREEQLLGLYRQQFGAYYQKVLTMLGKSERAQETALEQLIMERLLLSVAGTIPLELAPDYVGGELRQARVISSVLGDALPHYLFSKEGVLNYTTLKLFLQRQGLSVTDFERMVEDRLKVQMVVQLAQGSALVPTYAVDATLDALYRDKTFELETIGLAPYEQKIGAADEATLRAYYEEQNRMKSAFWSNEKRSGTVWSFDLATYGLDAEQTKKMNAQELESFFEKSFLQEAGYVTQAGQDNLFKAYIDEKRPKRSELQGITQVAEPSIERLFILSAPGERGVVVKGKRGFIVELSEVLPREELPYEQVSERVQRAYVKEMARKQVAEAWSSGELKAVPGYRKQTITLVAGSTAKSTELSQYGLHRNLFNGLLSEGAQRTGMTPDYGYRVTLTKVGALQEKRLAEEGGKEKVRQSLYESMESRILENFVASLRNNAILSLRLTENKLG